MAWNFTHGPVTGTKVSGTSIDNSLFQTEVVGPDMLTGGDFGVEGGLIAIIISALFLLVLLKAHWLQPSQRFLDKEEEWKVRIGVSPEPVMMSTATKDTI
jgi:hypothetical protein